MCYHYSLTKKAQEVESRYNASFEQDHQFLKDNGYEAVYVANGFTHPKMPVITDQAPHTIKLFQWGLIPNWAKDREFAEDIANKTLNARSETAWDKPAFRNAVRNQRCLVPADGFYEWYTYKGKKYPHFIYMADRSIFSLAGIWSTWKEPETGAVISTYSVLTTVANPLLARVHNAAKRMPVILPPNVERDWLNDGLTKEDVQALTQPVDDSHMKAHPISKLITSRKQNPNVPEVQKPYDYAELE